MDTGSEVKFTTFLFPGVLAMSVLFSAAFAGISLVWDREFGFLREMLVAPVSKAAIIIGKCLGGALALERPAPGQALVGDQAERVEVAAGSGPLAEDLLGAR